MPRSLVVTQNTFRKNVPPVPAYPQYFTLKMEAKISLETVAPLYQSDDTVTYLKVQ